MMTKILSLGGRLRMAAACPDANAPLLAKAADAIEQHEAFKQEVSDALVIYSPENRNPALGRFIINADKPDALVDVWGDLFIKSYNLDQFCDALEARGLEIREKDE
jgi:hypothetical protein